MTKAQVASGTDRHHVAAILTRHAPEWAALHMLRGIHWLSRTSCADATATSGRRNIKKKGRPRATLSAPWG
ncbi:MAG: hypothetical protein KAI82_19095, partial [Tritonibacter mobilis]|nr:hypothetical protein [Tritonibacter mobilis]